MKTKLIAILIISAFLLSCSDGNVTNTRKYRLTTSANPTESGTVTPSAGEYEEGVSVQLTATPNQDWVFTKWEGDYTGTGSSVSVMMDRDKNISALFTKREYPLTIEIEGEGTVDEQVVQQKTTDYPAGTTVSLTAVASEGWHFDHWEGDLEGNENPATIEITAQKTVTAVFERKDYPLTVNIEGNGTVSEEIVHAKTTNYPYQTSVKLTAIPSEGWIFSEWVGDLEGSNNPAQVTVENAVALTAVFVRDYFTITVNLEGPGSWTVDLISGNQQEDTYEYESRVRIKVVPLEDGMQFRFVEWQGDLSGTENPIDVTVTGDITATAILEQTLFEGEGTVSNPYKVATLEQLQAVRGFIDKHFLQVADIDASETATWENGLGFQPIGFHEVQKFRGTYNGGDFTISGLTIKQDVNYNTHEYAFGLFGFLEHAHIKNLTLENVTITGTDGVGGIAGYVGDSSLLENVHVISGSVTGKKHVGGLAGFVTNSIITVATSQVDVEGETSVGGLVGNAFASRVNASRSYGDVTGVQNVGGLIGLQQQSKMLTNSYARGEVTGTINVGGLIGASFNTAEMIRVTFATGNVTGNQNTGGLVGFYTGTAVISETYATGNISSENGMFIGGLVGRVGAGKIYKSYALGDVSGNTAIGGFVGRNDPDGEIVESFSAGLVSGTLQHGGFAGSNQGSGTNNYWDNQASNHGMGVGDGISVGVIGLPTSQMTGVNVQWYMTGFDWINTWNSSEEYPVLKVFTVESPIP